MSRTVTLEALAVRVCASVRALAGDRQAWIAIDLLHPQLSSDEARSVHAAIAFAVAKGWLAISRVPADHVLLKPGAP